MESDQQLRRSRVESASDQPRLEFSVDELSEVLQQASSIQAMKQKSGREVTTLADAMEAARELGISEENVREAAEQLRRKKERLARLKRIVRTRRNNFLRLVMTTATVCAIVAVAGGLDAARAVFFGMSIALVIVGIRWGRAILAQRYPDILDSPSRGECSVCGEQAWDRKATLCADHRRLLNPRADSSTGDLAR